jgi:hypothetical protein
MKKYVIGLILGCIALPCFAERTKLIDFFDSARKQVETATCKMRNVILPNKKEVMTLDKAQKLLTDIKTGFTTVRTIVIDALEKNSFNEKLLKKTLTDLTNYEKKLFLLETLDQAAHDELKAISDMIVLSSLALVEEAGVLDLWVQGYDAYLRDLEDNLKNLPNKAVKKPDFNKLYEELGMSTAEGKKASFNTIQAKYSERFDALNKQHPKDFDETYFRPYLRVLQYVFRTPYSKNQYDAFLAGKAAYDAKGKVLAAYKPTIQKLFGEDIPVLRMISGTLQSEFC